MEKAANREARKEARLAKKAAKGAGAGGGDEEGASTPKTPKGAGAGNGASASSARTATGILTSERRSKDVHIASFGLNLHGMVLVEDTDIELIWGHRFVADSLRFTSTARPQFRIARAVPAPVRPGSG
jgi:ATP-binding cassette subfamily F protein 2